MAITIYKFAYHVDWNTTGIARTGGRAGTSLECDLSNYYTKTNLITPGEALISSLNIFWAIQAGHAASYGVATVSGRLIRDGLIKGTANGIVVVNGVLRAIYSAAELYTFDMSVIADSDNIVTLVNDEESPGPGLVYGTDSGGTKGWVDSGGSGGSYTNATPVPQTIGGITAGDTFLAVSMAEMWDALLYPYQYPTFLSFSISGQATTLECGVYITAGAKTFVWDASNDDNVEINSIDIDDVTRVINLITGTANDNSESLTITAVTSLSTGGTNTWRITGTNTNAEDFTRNWTVTWYSPYFYGVGAAGLTVAQIQQLTKVVTSSSNKNYVFNPVSQVYYFAYPASYGELSSILDTNGFETIGDWTLRVENFTINSPYYEGGTVSYNIYEFNNVTTQTNFTNHFIY